MQIVDPQTPPITPGLHATNPFTPVPPAEASTSMSSSSILPLSPTSPTTRPKACWTTLITKPQYLQGLIVLASDLASVQSAYPLVVMVTPALDEESRNVIRGRGLKMIEVESISPGKGRNGFDQGFFARFADTWTKLRAFGLMEYEKVVLMDCDMIVRRNMDELMTLNVPDDCIASAHACTCNPLKLAHYPVDWVPANCAYSIQSHPESLTHPTPAANISPLYPIPTPQSTLLPSPENSPTSPSTPLEPLSPHASPRSLPSLNYQPRTHALLNSGLVVLTPSAGAMENIISFIQTSSLIPTFKFPDQDALAVIYQGRWRALPWCYNALKTLRGIHNQRDGGIWVDEEVRCLHYILDKPWEAPRPSTITSDTPSTHVSHHNHGSTIKMDHSEVNEWWWTKYEDVLGEMKGIEGSGWELVDKWVVR